MKNKQITVETIEYFKNQLVQDEKSQATIEKYLRDVRKFYNYLEGKEVTKARVIEYKQKLNEAYEVSSVNSMIVALNCYLKMMGWQDCVVKTLKVQKQAFRNPERELTKEEYMRLLNTARKNNNIRLYLLMQTICSTGIRVSELQYITVEAVAMKRAKVCLKGKTRIILLPKELCRELKCYAKYKHIYNGSVFITRSGKPMDRSNIFHQMKSLCMEANVSRKKVFPHNLRHLFACMYYQAIKDLSRLADILGHSSVNTTRIYTHVSGTEQVRQIEKLGLVYPYKIQMTT